MEKIKCIMCGEPVKKNAKKYCSPQCQQDFYWIERKNHYEKTGVWFSHNGTAKQDAPLGRNYKRYILEKRGCKCEICGRTKWNGQKIPIVLDHINGDSTNWNLENLRLICPNCDAQTPTYKSKNKGNGRYLRRERYRQGKSY